MASITYQRGCQGCKTTSGSAIFDVWEENDDFLFDRNGNIKVSEAIMIQEIRKGYFKIDQKCENCGESNKWLIWDVCIDFINLKSIGGKCLDEYYYFINLADENMDLGNYKLAIGFFSKAIAINPFYSDAFFGRGCAKQMLKEYVGDFDDFSTTLRLNPFFTDAYINRGVAQYSIKDYAEAIQDFNEAIKLNPKDALAYFSRGKAKYDQENFNGALKDFEYVIELNPKGDLAQMSQSRIEFIEFYQMKNNPFR